MLEEYNREKLAEKLHEWYLEATQKLHPESFNPNAQKEYSELTDEQKQIDRYIAEKVLSLIDYIVLSLIIKMIEEENKWSG